jgi:hypothetical protein
MLLLLEDVYQGKRDSRIQPLSMEELMMIRRLIAAYN